jgi:hypothetical protein
MRRVNAVTVIAVGVALAWGCSNPADVSQGSLSNQGAPIPRGDGTVKRLALSDRPLALKVSPTGFAYISQIDASRLVRLNLSTQTFGDVSRSG